MLVKELIKLLQQYDSEQEVVLQDDDCENCECMPDPMPIRSVAS